MNKNVIKDNRSSPDGVLMALQRVAILKMYFYDNRLVSKCPRTQETPEQRQDPVSAQDPEPIQELESESET